MPVPRLRRVLHLIRIFAFESCAVDRRHTEKVLRPVVHALDLKLRLRASAVTGQRRIACTQALDAYVKPVALQRRGRDSCPNPEARWLRSGGTPGAHQVGGGRREDCNSARYRPWKVLRPGVRNSLRLSLLRDSDFAGSTQIGLKSRHSYSHALGYLDTCLISECLPVALGRGHLTRVLSTHDPLREFNVTRVMIVVTSSPYT